MKRLLLFVRMPFLLILIPSKLRLRALIMFVLLLPTPSTYSQKIGIGTVVPAEKLDVAGNIKADTIKPAAIKFPLNAGVGKILTSDATGNASWQETISNNAGFGGWGDCATNSTIGGYQPVADTGGSAGDIFGYTVSISGNYAIVGARDDDGPAGNNQGSANIYQFNGNSWVLMQKLTDATGSGGDQFGGSVSISGNYAIIGANGDDAPLFNQGSASIYQYNGTTWVLMQKLTDATGGSGDFFGNSVAISGNYVIVGAYSDDDVALNQGSVSIYQYNGSSWVLMQKITDATGLADDNFGYSVSISGNYAIAGAYLDDGPAGVNMGSASLYQWNGSNWLLMQKITDATGAAGDFFGQSVSISGNYAIVGAYGDDEAGGSQQGSASIYQWNGTSWVLMQKLTEVTGSANDFFGNSVFISGNYAIVGAYSDSGPLGLFQGSSNIYYMLGPVWIKLQYITDPAGNASESFGAAVSIDAQNKRFVIGAYNFANRGKVIFGKIN